MWIDVNTTTSKQDLRLLPSARAPRPRAAIDGRRDGRRRGHLCRRRVGACRRRRRRRGGWSAVACQVWRVRVGCRAARASIRSALGSASTLRRLVYSGAPGPLAFICVRPCCCEERREDIWNWFFLLACTSRIPAVRTLCMGVVVFDPSIMQCMHAYVPMSSGYLLLLLMSRPCSVSKFLLFSDTISLLFLFNKYYLITD